MGESNITTRFNVKGLSDLERAVALKKQLNQGGSSSSSSLPDFSKSAGSIKTLNSQFANLKANVKNIGSANLSSLDAKFSSTGAKANTLKNNLNQAKSAVSQVNSASLGGLDSKLVATATKGTKLKTVLNQDRTAATQLGSTALNGLNSGLDRATSKAGRFGSALKQAFGMFTIGQLGANAVMAGVQGIKNLFKGGIEYNKWEQGSDVGWKSAIGTAHSDLSDRQLVQQSRQATKMVATTAQKAGNDAEQVGAMFRGIYGSDEQGAAGYSGNLKATQKVTQGVLNIQDANALSGQQMDGVTNALAKIGDLGKMNGKVAQQLQMADNQITKNIKKEYEKETGEKFDGDWSKVNASTAYKAIDKYGNSGEVGKAAENFNKTLGGAQRSVKSGLASAMGEFQKSFVGAVNKGLGGDGGLFAKISDFFNKGDAINVAKDVAEKLGGFASAIGQVGKAIAPIVGGAFDGFTKTVGVVTKGLSSIAKVVGDLAGKIGGPAKGLLSGAGKVAGVGLAGAGLSKLLPKSLTPKLQSGISGLLSKIMPDSWAGKISSLFGRGGNTNDTAANKQLQAASMQLQAAGKFGGGLTDLFGGNGKNKAVNAADDVADAANVFGGGGKAALAKTYGKGTGFMQGARNAKGASTGLKGAMKGLGGGLKGAGGKTIAAMGGKAIPLIGTGLTVLDGLSKFKNAKNDKERGSAIGSTGGALGGAGLGAAIGTAILPGLGTIIGGIIGGVGGSKVGEKIGKSKAGQKIGGAANKVKKEVGSTWNNLKDGVNEVKENVQDSFSENLGWGKGSKKSNNSAIKTEEGTTNRIKRSAKNQEGMSTDDINKQNKAISELDKKQKNYNKAVKDYGKNSNDAKNAKKKLDDAQKKADKTLTKAQKQQAKYEDNVKSVAKKEKDNAKAHQDAAKASDKYAKAQEKTAKASEKVKQAEKDFGKDSKAYKKAVDEKKKATEDEAKSKKKSEDATKKAKAAEDDLKRARDNAAKAAEAVGKAGQQMEDDISAAGEAGKKSGEQIQEGMEQGQQSADDAAASVQSLSDQINNLPTEKTVTINVQQNGSVPAQATGTPNAFSKFTNVSKYAKGTKKAHPGGLALVNDAKGSNYQEAFMTPDGSTGLFPKSRNILMDMPKGTEVLDGKSTAKMFGARKYENGTTNAIGGTGTYNITMNIYGTDKDLADKVSDKFIRTLESFGVKPA